MSAADHTYQEIFDLCVELEGLIALRLKRDDINASHIHDMMLHKSAVITDALAAMPRATAPELDSEEAEAIAQAAEMEEAEDADEAPAAAAVEAAAAPVEPVRESAEEPQEEPADEPQTEAEESAPTVEAERFAAPGVLRNDSLRQPEFSLNDKFRFRRDLFDGSDADMADALEVAQQMTSADEVEDYFLNDLCWDSSNPSVKDFLTIITARFAAPTTV